MRRIRSLDIGGRAAAVAAATVMCCAVGCEPYRIEYRKMPEFYRKASESRIPDRYEREDGTVVVNVFGDESEGEMQRKANSKSEPFKIREETESGEVRIRALLPEHVLANTMTCIKNQEYELLWEQMLSERTKMAYAEQGMSKEQFVQFFQEHRQELARTVNRMILGLPRQEVVAENLGGGIIQYRFQPHVARAFRFTKVQIVNEGLGLKLLIIK